MPCTMHLRADVIAVPYKRPPAKALLAASAGEAASLSEIRNPPPTKNLLEDTSGLLRLPY